MQRLKFACDVCGTKDAVYNVTRSNAGMPEPYASSPKETRLYHLCNDCLGDEAKDFWTRESDLLYFAN